MTTTSNAALPRAMPEPALGTVIVAGGLHFNLFSSGEGVELLLFDRADDERPAQVMNLERSPHPSGHYWHRFVPGVGVGQIYGFRVVGPFAPERGLRFDRDKLLLDPYARSIATPPTRSRSADSCRGDNTASALRSVVVDSDAYDWANDRRPRVPDDRTVIYEMHVGHFTADPQSGVAAARRGTFAGVVEKIPYLCDLGVTSLELMPVFAFDEQAAPAGLQNVWGYEPISFFAPHERYSSRPGAAVDEFRDMIKMLHRAGIEVILDVVYNHSAEDDVHGPTLGFRGLANEVYYSLLPDGSYANYSGCGNTLNVNSPVVTRLILDSLRYWVGQMHVDGFRFDLAAVLLRDGDGRPDDSAPILRAIDSEPMLRDVKLIAEAWDAAGLYGLGRFASRGWREWNGRFRDDARRFLKSDEGMVRQIACRLAGSPDVYPVQRCVPVRSINFVTSHDGFTLNDLVSYNQKHNEANGEHNRDGSNENYSWNCGIEGPSENVEVSELRTRQVKNFLVLMLLASGTPMLLMGDEVRRTQHGNNNGYCSDEAGAWFDWGAVEGRADVHRFARELIGLRAGRRRSERCLRGSIGLRGVPRQMEWHGVRLREPDWSEQSHSLAVRIAYESSEIELYVILNAYWEALTFELPPLEEAVVWWRCVDTFRRVPEDICLGADAQVVVTSSILVQPRSIVVLVTADRSRPPTQTSG